MFSNLKLVVRAVSLTVLAVTCAGALPTVTIAISGTALTSVAEPDDMHWKFSSSELQNNL